MANLDIITTPFDIVMLVELRCVGTHACSFAVSTNRNRFLTSYLPRLMTRPFSKGSTLKGKNPIFFFKK